MKFVLRSVEMGFDVTLSSRLAPASSSKYERTTSESLVAVPAKSSTTMRVSARSLCDSHMMTSVGASDLSCRSVSAKVLLSAMCVTCSSCCVLMLMAAMPTAAWRFSHSATMWYAEGADDAVEGRPPRLLPPRLERPVPPRLLPRLLPPRLRLPPLPPPVSSCEKLLLFISKASGAVRIAEERRAPPPLPARDMGRGKPPPPMPVCAVDIFRILYGTREAERWDGAAKILRSLRLFQMSNRNKRIIQI